MQTDITLTRLLESHIVSILIIGAFSVGSAAIMFLVGGSFAEVSDQEGTFLGLTFKAGGAIAGFILVFLLMMKTLGDLRASSPTFAVKVPAIDSEPTQFSRNKTYTCSYRLFATDTGETETKSARYTWEAGFLTVFVNGVGGRDLLRVQVQDGDRIWESEDFQPTTRKTEVALVSQTPHGDGG